MNTFSDKEIKEIESLEDLKDMVTVLDSILDGEVFRVRNTETDITINENLKPVLPKGLITSDKADSLANKTLYAYVLHVLISLLIDLNPINDVEEEDYAFRLAIIVNAITSGCLVENRNWKYADVTFDVNFVKSKGKEYYTKNKEMIIKIKSLIPAAHTFIAFSSMNMVRFNHHYPIEKINLITKGLSGLPESQRDRILEEEKLETFYNYFVTAGRIINDKKLYEKYILKKSDDGNKYLYYKVLGSYDIVYDEEIIKIRNVNTPNGFLILDIINEIQNDLLNRKILFAIPYRNEIASLLQIRRHIRLNPFGYHPSRHFYKCAAKDYDDILGKFQNLMKKVGSFVYQYSESMYESVKAAKCRAKYEKNIKREDEVLVKILNSLNKVDISLNNDKIEIIKKKLNISNINIEEDTDIDKLNKDLNEQMQKVINDALKI